MHEMSIAESLVEQVRRHTPAGHRATIVRVEAGPLQAIAPQSLEWAWQALTEGTELEHSALEFRALPFEVSCPRCGRTWTSEDPFNVCTCGAEARSKGSPDLKLISLEVEVLTPVISA